MEEKEILVKAEELSKKFCKDLKTSLWYGVKDLIQNVQGNKQERLLRDKEFWAVKDISFELRRGECLGLIGHNGAGKSTLLKILNGLIKPDAGKVTIKGKVGALIELGAGFNPILTGRENIYNNGAVLGFSRVEINEKVEEIIDFAELREFIDMPVKNYSSGMKVRLGFAVAAQMEPDVLIIDEVLAVGDLGFMLKCFKTIDNILPKTAIVFVSHSMPKISRLCNQIILMDKGIAKFSGENVPEAIDLYYKKFAGNDKKIVLNDGNIIIDRVELQGVNYDDKNIPQLKWYDDFKFLLEIRIFGLKRFPTLAITIFDKEQRPIAVFEKNKDFSEVKLNDGHWRILVTHKNLQLAKGIYSLNVTFKDGSKPIFRINDIIAFQVNYEEDVWQSLMLKADYDVSNFRNRI